MKLKVVVVLVLSLLSILSTINLPPAAASTPASFTFTASGDHDSLTSPTGAANLNRVQATPADFYLSLGDMSYNPAITGEAWCGQFKTKFNNIEIIPGDHDTGGHNSTSFGETHSYEKYLTTCPLTVNTSIVCGPAEDNCFGKEYYFDYPSNNPIARLIFTSPKIYNITGVCTQALEPPGNWPGCSSQTNQPCSDSFGCWQYNLNDNHYTWVAGAIDNARNRGIKWVIVAMHKVCISSSDATCSMGIAFFNMLLSKKVDLIIQAHDNAYQRSKQLGLGPGTCPNGLKTDGNGFVVYNSTYSGCIVDNGSRGYYTPGVGTVSVIQGAWINDLYGVNQSAHHQENAKEAPYFASLMGSNTPGWGLGFVKYTVSPERIDVQTAFSSSFQDSFSILAGPSPVPVAMWNPSNPQVGQIVTFNGTVIGGTPPYSFTWSFGDGAAAQGNIVRHMYLNSRTYNVTLTATDANDTNGTTRRTIPVGSWNPWVGCSPTSTTVEAIVGNVQVQRNATNPSSIGPDYSGGFFKLDGVHAVNSSFATWPFSKRSLQPPCSANGYASFVEVRNVQVLSVPTPGVALYDCRTKYSSANGNGPFPNGRDCDYAFNAGNASYTMCPACNLHRVYSDIDGDWNASGVAPLPGPTQAVVIDIQGFVYWNPKNIVNSTSHSFTGWEIHPVTAWRVHVASLTASFNTSPASPTAGQATRFTASVSGGTGPYTYTWDFGDGSTSKGTANQATHTYTTTGIRTVQVFVNDTLGASGTFSKNLAIADAVIVTVSCGNSTAGKPVVCNASAAGGTPPYAFSWSAPGGTPPTGAGASFTTTYTVKGTYIVNATAADSKGAQSFSTASIIVGSQQLTVTASQSQPAMVDRFVGFTSTVLGGTSPYSYQWSVDGLGVSGATQATFSCNFTTSGLHSVNVNVTDANFAKTSTLLSVQVYPRLTIGFTGSTAPIVGRLANFTGSASGGSEVYMFRWNFSDGSTGNGASTSHIYNAAGNYNVTLTIVDSLGFNSTVWRILTVWKVPDIDGDGTVTILDAAQIAFAFDSKTPDPRYNPNLDMNADGKIDILDAALVAFYFDTTGW